jgi:hypothetical protein
MQRDLVERAMGGDRDAFAHLQRRSIDKLYATARLILGDSDLAQDATQEAFIAAWRGLRGLRDPRDSRLGFGVDAPDGSAIVWNANRGGMEVHLVTSTESPVQLPTHLSGFEGAWAPDSTRLIGVSGNDLVIFESSGSDMVVLVVPGRRSPTGARPPIWTIDASGSRGGLRLQDGLQPAEVGFVLRSDQAAHQGLEGFRRCRSARYQTEIKLRAGGG